MADLVKYQEDARNYLDLEFKKVEKTLSKKYCIKSGSIYCLYGLNS